MTKLAKQYQPKQHEADIYQRWEESGAFQPDETSSKEPFVISLPPPNITGSLHLGHALQDTIMDILTRYHRMQGHPTLWQPGTDSAAIATNKVIENQLAEEGTTRWEIGREQFLNRTEDWYDKTGAEILNQMKRLGCSCDWQRGRFTMDEQYIAAVNEAFVHYHHAGYLYRGSRIVNWDPATQTTVSDLEIEWQTKKTPFYTFKFGPFEIGTARPETKFGDKYVVMHPDDQRYAKYQHGDTFEAEWINGPITATVIKDEAVDPKFGSGVMTITPWHDATDFSIARQHNLDMEQIIDFEGNLLPIAEEFAGLPITDARPQIVAKLDSKGLVVSVDNNYEHNIALNDRGKGTIEPQIMRQWFVDMSKLKDDTIKAAEEGAVRFIPPRWQKHFIDWMNNVLDWNINRQIWLGHRLPVWWKPGTHGTDNEEGNYVVSVEKPHKDGEVWEQDPDVLDTWFATALWPFAILGWPNNDDDLKKYYPTSVLVTARDILYLWVARMVFSGLEFMQGNEYDNRSLEQRIPFKDVFIHPTVLAKDGRRMSKSLGTGIDPLDLIEEYGADATRFGLMYQMSYDNQAIRFDEADVKAARNFANKIWNIARLLQSMHDQDQPTVADHWIASRLQQVTSEVTEHIQNYKIGEATHLLYSFIWSDFADWYLEILKTGGSTKVARGVFTDTLKLLHPFMPYLTEALWPHFGQDLLITTAWPTGSQQPADQEASRSIELFQDIVATTRSARLLLDTKPSATIDLYLEEAPPLTAAISKMARANIIDHPAKNMTRFPLATGNSLYLGAEEITKESIAAAKDRLDKKAKEISAFISNQKKIIAGMQGKAPDSVVAAKQEALTQAKQQLVEVQLSQKLLS